MAPCATATTGPRPLNSGAPDPPLNHVVICGGDWITARTLTKFVTSVSSNAAVSHTAVTQSDYTDEQLVGSRLLFITSRFKPFYPPWACATDTQIGHNDLVVTVGDICWWAKYINAGGFVTVQLSCLRGTDIFYMNTYWKWTHSKARAIWQREQWRAQTAREKKNKIKWRFRWAALIVISQVRRLCPSWDNFLNNRLPWKVIKKISFKVSPWFLMEHPSSEHLNHQSEKQPDH